MKKLKNSKFYLLGLLSVIALGAFVTFAYATNDNSSTAKADQCLNKGEKSELAMLKCGEESDAKKCGEAEGEKKCGEADGEKKCGEGDDKKCSEGDDKKCGEGKCGDSQDDADATDEVEEAPAE